jgi:hypothetical protein
MIQTASFDSGGYRYIPAGFRFSAGVAAEPGFELERVRLATPLPLPQGFAAIEAYLNRIGRPLTALAQVELRSPEPLSDEGFLEFNRQYVMTLQRWGLFHEGAPNPVARTNVCPFYGRPSEPVIDSFCHTIASERPAFDTFVLAGAGEARPGAGSYEERVVRWRDTSPEGLREKLRYVVQETERRLRLLGFDWRDAAVTRAYTVLDIGHLVGEQLASRGALSGGLVWHYTRPPAIGMEVELDAYRVRRELLP